MLNVKISSPENMTMEARLSNSCTSEGRLVCPATIQPVILVPRPCTSWLLSR